MHKTLSTEIPFFGMSFTCNWWICGCLSALVISAAYSFTPRSDATQRQLVSLIQYSCASLLQEPNMKATALLLDVQVGAIVEVPLRVNASGVRLQAADVEVGVDEQALEVLGCKAGAQVVRPAGFECRFNMFGHLDSVQISYVDDQVSLLQSGATSSDFPAELAVLELRVCKHARTAE
jgi:hypothetical protein